MISRFVQSYILIYFGRDKALYDGQKQSLKAADLLAISCLLSPVPSASIPMLIASQLTQQQLVCNMDKSASPIICIAGIMMDG